MAQRKKEDTEVCLMMFKHIGHSYDEVLWRTLHRDVNTLETDRGCWNSYCLVSQGKFLDAKDEIVYSAAECEHIVRQCWSVYAVENAIFRSLKYPYDSNKLAFSKAKLKYGAKV